jgi:TonB-linked SusC/RagA family outer membrane protein
VRIHVAVVRRAPAPLATALLVLLCVATVAHAQVGRIVGTVSDSLAGAPIGSVRVVVNGTTLGAVSGDDGKYTILRVPPGTYTLETRRLGYVALVRAGVVVTAGQATTVNFRVAQAALHLQASVITGVVDPTSGTKVPFTVGHVTKEDAPVPPINAIAGVQGKISGVSTVAPAQPGDGISIQIRTPTSVNKTSAPLIVVDGVILSESTADLNSLDIESIEVVKGAAGASLYGSRAANGVVNIRTARGKGLGTGQTQFTLRSELGSNSLVHQLHWAQYHYYLTNASGQYVNAAGAVVTRSQRVARPAATRFQDVPYIDPLYDPVKLFFDPGQFMTNSFTVAQNGDRTNWLSTLSSQRQDGVILGHGGYNRNDVRINLDHTPRSNLSLSLSGYNSRSDREELEGNTFFDLINQAPDLNLLQPDPDGTKYIFQPDPQGIRANPLYIAETDKNNTQRTRTLGNMGLRWVPLSWLTADADASYDRSDQNGREWIDRGLKIEAAPGISTGSLTLTNAYTSAVNLSASGSVLKKFGALTARSTARILTEQQKTVNGTASGTNFAVAGTPRLNAALVKNSSSSNSEIVSEGYFLTGGLDYDSRLILDGLVRRDGSSLFGPGEKWHTYYRGSAAYRLAAERWWPWRRIDEFKLRISQGTAGNRPSFADQYETYTVSGSGTLAKGTLGNRFLKPETSKETELGLDVIVDNKYSLQVSRASVKSTDQLLQIPLPGALGFTTQWRNAGTVLGNTLEATVEAQLYRSGATTWRMGLTFDRSRNHISELNSSCFLDGVTYRCAGEDLTTMYGTAFVHAKSQLPTAQANALDQFDVNDDGLVVAVGPGGKYTDGKWGTTVVSNGVTYNWGMPIILRDSSGQNAIVRIGAGNPKYRYGISNNVQWHGIQFYGLIDTQVGGNVYNTTKQRMYQFQRSADVDQTGKPAEKKKPIDYYVNLYNGATTTDWFVESGSYVKLREISMRYQIPKRIFSRLPGTGAVGASLSLVGRNLYTWTTYSGYDPEVGSVNQRVDSYAYPLYRTITGVVQLQF